MLTVGPLAPGTGYSRMKRNILVYDVNHLMNNK